jgi:hypothetical protein
MLQQIIRPLLTFFLITTTLQAGMVESINKTTKSWSDATLLSKDLKTGLIVDHLLTDALIASWGFKY